VQLSVIFLVITVVGMTNEDFMKWKYRINHRYDFMSGWKP